MEAKLYTDEQIREWDRADAFAKGERERLTRKLAKQKTMSGQALSGRQLRFGQSELLSSEHAIEEARRNIAVRIPGRLGILQALTGNCASSGSRHRRVRIDLRAG